MRYPPPNAKAARSSSGEALPPALRAFFESTNGLSLDVTRRTGAMQGRLRLLSVEEMFGGADKRRAWNDDAFRGSLWLDDFADDHSRAQMHRFRRLRPLEWNEDQPTTCVDFSKPKKARLIVLDRWHITDLRCDVDGYFRALIETLGFDGWLAPLVDPKSSDEGFRERARDRSFAAGEANEEEGRGRQEGRDRREGRACLLRSHRRRERELFDRQPARDRHRARGKAHRGRARYRCERLAAQSMCEADRARGHPRAAS